MTAGIIAFCNHKPVPAKYPLLKENLNFSTLYVTSAKFQKVHFISSHSHFLVKCNMICWVLYIVSFKDRHKMQTMTQRNTHICVVSWSFEKENGGLLYQSNHNLQELCSFKLIKQNIEHFITQKSCCP